jgi:hypothetical protein
VRSISLLSECLTRIKDFDQDGSRLVRIVENEVGYKNLRWAV